MAREALTRQQLTALLQRANGRCERCGRYVVDEDTVEFEGRGEWWSVQHRKPAGMGGTTSPAFNSPANVALLCGHGTTGCHGWAETYRDDARVTGWLVSQSLDPATIPVMPLYRRRVLLTADWRYEEVPDGFVER